MGFSHRHDIARALKQIYNVELMFKEKSFWLLRGKHQHSIYCESASDLFKD